MYIYIYICIHIYTYVLLGDSAGNLRTIASLRAFGRSGLPKVEPERLDYIYLLPIFFDGLVEKENPCAGDGSKGSGIIFIHIFVCMYVYMIYIHTQTRIYVYRPIYTCIYICMSRSHGCAVCCFACQSPVELSQASEPGSTALSPNRANVVVPCSC